MPKEEAAIIYKALQCSSCHWTFLFLFFENFHDIPPSLQNLSMKHIKKITFETFEASNYI